MHTNKYVYICVYAILFLKFFFFFNVDCFKVFIEFVAILLLFHVLVFGPGACGISTP